MSKSKTKIKRRLLFILSIIFIISISIYGFIKITPIKIGTEIKYVSSNIEKVSLYDETFKEVDYIYRGKKVKVYLSLVNDENNNKYYKINYNGKDLYIKESNLVKETKLVVQESKVFVRTPSSIYKSIDNSSILGLASKGQALDVIGFDKVDNQGRVNFYKTKVNDNEGYIYAKYVLLNEEDANKQYEPVTYYDVHNNRGNRYNGGHAGNLDYYPVSKPKFEDNVMPDKVYALYLNGGSNVIGNVDEYIKYAKTTNINAFVVDIKDNQSPSYKSPVSERYSPTNYKYGNNSFDKYKDAIKKIKEAGFYVIGRITVFKDKYYCNDHPEDAILNTETNEPFLHNGTYWPSAYKRTVWEYNVELAKEAVKEMGFNEIQFDYVRFPDQTGTYEKSGLMDFRNEYKEDKGQAIQRFLMYATDEIHKLGAYVAADVFGESAYDYVTAYGQYWPAISNVVDVISGMPYPDHFAKNTYGLPVPWTEPYELLYRWGSKYVMQRQKEIPTPATVRTWIQVYDVANYKHPGGYAYGFNQIDAQIRGLFDAGLTGGYMTWLSYSGLDKYKSQKEVYDKEY